MPNDIPELSFLISPECKAQQHTFCDIGWVDQDGHPHICDCQDGRCHDNAKYQEMEGQTSIPFVEG